MDGAAAETIIKLNDQRNRLEAEKRQALLAQAEMQHELNMLRHMRYQIAGCLLDRRSNGNTAHTLAKVSRIIINSRTENAHGNDRQRAQTPGARA